MDLIEYNYFNNGGSMAKPRPYGFIVYNTQITLLQQYSKCLCKAYVIINVKCDNQIMSPWYMPQYNCKEFLFTFYRFQRTSFAWRPGLFLHRYVHNYKHVKRMIHKNGFYCKLKLSLAQNT